MKYWMVHNPDGEPPRARHRTEQSAIDEAKRLARLNPDEWFVVLEAKHIVRKVDVEVKSLVDDVPMTDGLEGPF